jgi:pyrimidine-nucleoside phosphorylase
MQRKKNSSPSPKESSPILPRGGPDFMNIVHLISKKRDGDELADFEIGALIDAYAKGDVPDYQMAAWAMAVYLRGMTVAETAALTEHMLHSGATFNWPAGEPPKVDKHSTGGIGDKVSLVLAPLLACCELQVPMISGRGLGPTGGTLDKLESIPGFRTNLSTEEMQSLTRRVGCVISGATADLVPADRELYALRDVTATVPSIPLITGSIMSKKLAEGLDALVLDVKWGSGAFMKTRAGAHALARSMVDTGRRMHVPTTAIVTDMNQPLGRMAGNAVEVNESISALMGRGPADLLEITLELGAELLVLARRASSLAAGKERLQHAIASGAGVDKFREMVVAQGGDLDAPRPVAPASEVAAHRAGYVTAINTEALGHVVIELGGGRKKLGDAIDHSTGLEMLVRLGEPVQAGQPLARVFAKAVAAARVEPELVAAITIGDDAVEPPVLIAERIT